MKHTLQSFPKAFLAIVAALSKMAVRSSHRSPKLLTEKKLRRPTAVILDHPTVSRFPDATPSRFPCTLTCDKSSGTAGHTSARIPFALALTSRQTAARTLSSPASKVDAGTPHRASAARKMATSVL